MKTLALLSPLLLAWTGSGEGVVQWTAGDADGTQESQRFPVDVVARVTPDEQTQMIISFALTRDLGDGVLSLRLDDRLRYAGAIELPDSRVQLRYQEYDLNGGIHFKAQERVRGRLLFDGGDNRWAELELLLGDTQSPSWRRLERLQLDLRPVDPVEESEPDSDQALLAPGGGGCDEGWDEDEEYEDDYEGSSSSGCDGDDLDDGSSSPTSAPTSDSGGCEGDGESADSGGCEGDDLDADGGDSGCSLSHKRKRNPWILRALNWVPWLLCFLSLRLFRRRRAQR